MKGKMISVKTEDKIRWDMRNGAKTSELALFYNVSRQTIARIRNVLITVEWDGSDSYGENTANYKTVVKRARLGYSQMATSARVGIPKQIVSAICRHAYVQRRNSDEPKARNRKVKLHSLGFGFADTGCAITILVDLESLGDLNLIDNQLFHNLIKRTTKLLDRMEKFYNV